MDRSPRFFQQEGRVEIKPIQLLSLSLSSHFHGTKAREERDTQAAGRNNEKNIGGIAGLVVQLPDYYSGSTPVILNSEYSRITYIFLFRKMFSR